MRKDGSVAKRGIGLKVLASWALATAITGLVVWRAVAVLDDGTRTDVLSGAQVTGLLQSASATAGTTSPAAVTIPPVPTEPSATSGGQGTPATSTAPVTSPVTPAKTLSTAPSTKPPAPSPTLVARTWNVEGGVVSVACSNQVITLRSASPADGWRVRIESRGPDRVKVEFVAAEREISVSGVCVAGVPQQTTHE